MMSAVARADSVPTQIALHETGQDAALSPTSTTTGSVETGFIGTPFGRAPTPEGPQTSGCWPFVCGARHQRCGCPSRPLKSTYDRRVKALVEASKRLVTCGKVQVAQFNH